MDEQNISNRKTEEIWQSSPAGNPIGRRSMKIGITIVVALIVAAMLFLIYYVFFIPHFEISDPEWTVTLFGDADFTVTVRNVGYAADTISLVCEIEMEDGTIYSTSREITLSSGEERIYDVIVQIPLSRISDLANATGRCYLD